MTEKLHPVESCPGDADSWLKAGIRLNCPNDTIGRKLYHCAPNEDKTDLVEFCLKGHIGRYEEGLCIVAYPSRYIDAENCTTTFEHGCPEKSYISNEIYNYPACLEINRAAGCYSADLTCPSMDRTPANLTGSSVSYQDGLGNVTSATTNVTNPAHSNPQDFVHVTAAVVSSLLVIGIVFGIILFLRCRKKACWKRKQGYGKKRYMYGERLPLHNCESETFKSHDCAIYIGESKWETARSAKMESLPTDEKCILYTLLGYDDNTISWSDSKQWLSTLNDIRGTLFDAGSVSVKDTKKLKMELVQNNQQCLRIPSKRYAEDAMYQLLKSTESKFGCNQSYMLTLLCVTLVRKYCGTADQSKKGKKVLDCGDDLSPSLVYRLQMDILTHPTIESEAVEEAASWILNIPEEKLQSQRKRKCMYKNLCSKNKIDNGDVRKLGAVSWTRMTKEIVQGDMIYELRPQCARSTIGQHDHNDIFIVEGNMYALKDKFRVNGNIENLYAVLLSARFRVPVDKRYIFGGITEKTRDVVRFVSDEIRNEVMHSYVVRKLLTDDDMKNFIKDASDCLMEFGRLWEYNRKGKEPCLFIPEDMEELYLEKIGYVAMRQMHFEHLQNKKWKAISVMNDVPFDLCIQSGETRDRFVEYVHNEGRRPGENVESLKYMYSAFLFHNYNDQVQGVKIRIRIFKALFKERGRTGCICIPHYYISFAPGPYTRALPGPAGSL